MRWRSIRSRILIPLIAIQAASVTATALITATLSARRSEGQIVDRLNGVVDALGRASFPFTESVLARMSGLSGARFVAFGEDGRVTGSSLPGPDGLPASLRDVPATPRIESLGDAPRAVVGGVRYFAVALRPSAGPKGPSLLVLYPETSWRQARWEAAMPPLVLGVGSLAAMAAVTGWIAHRLGARIRRVERRVALIAEGDFRELDPGRGRDEVTDLVGSINLMCGQLREMRRAIETTERTRLLAQFAAGLAHQLRNSITGARMSVQLHARRHPSRDGDQSLDVALRQLAMTEEQVKGLLSLGRVEPRPPETFDLHRLLADVAVLVLPSCQHAKVRFRHPQGGPLRLLADPAGLRAAVLNLALNAVEAAGPGGEVGLSATVEGDLVAIEVVDTGPGPPPELADALCEPFVTGKPEGVGLGLALARQVAAEHGGHLSWSRAGGETRFTLTIPRRRNEDG